MTDHTYSNERGHWDADGYLAHVDDDRVGCVPCEDARYQNSLDNGLCPDCTDPWMFGGPCGDAARTPELDHRTRLEQLDAASAALRAARA